MRNPERIPKILEQLREIWEKNPDLRLAQMILNLDHIPGLYAAEDEALIIQLKKEYEVK